MVFGNIFKVIAKMDKESIDLYINFLIKFFILLAFHCSVKLFPGRIVYHKKSEKLSVSNNRSIMYELSFSKRV